jgi:hypothetical protein
MATLDPYLQGKADHMRGVPRDVNPFDTIDDLYGSPEWEAWFDGWDDADKEWGPRKPPKDKEAAN